MSLRARGGGLSIAHRYQAVNKECVNGGRSRGAPSSPKCKLHHMAAVCQNFFPEGGGGGGGHCVHCTAFTGLTFLLNVFILYLELTDKNFLSIELGQIIESFRISGSTRL